MTKLLVLDTKAYADRDISLETELLGPDVDIVRFAFDGNFDSLIEAAGAADVLLTDYTPLNSNVISRLTTCRLISVAATGYNAVDVEAARQAGISVCAIDEYCTQEVADHTLLLILALCRHLLPYHAQVQEEKLWRFDTRTGLKRLGDLTLGLIGYGRIGQAVAQRARAFGMAVIASDPYAEDATVKATTADMIYEKADVISLHCSLSEENHHMLDDDAFSKMARKPILINVARGGLVDEKALVQALDGGQVSGAGLDVLEEEVPGLESHPLLGRDNVILTPHVAFYSDASARENKTIAAMNIRHFLDGNHDAVRRYIHQTPTT